MGTLRGEQIIAQCFKREGVDTIFFMMGGPTGGTAGACLELGMKGIYVRHEQAAAMMAHAYCARHRQARHLHRADGPRRRQPGDRARQRVGRRRAGYRDRRLRADARHHARHLPGDGSGSDDEADRQGAPIASTSATASPSTSVSRSARRSTASADRSTSICPATCCRAKSRKRKFIGSRATSAPMRGRPATRR